MPKKAEENDEEDCGGVVELKVGEVSTETEHCVVVGVGTGEGGEGEEFAP